MPRAKVELIHPGMAELLKDPGVERDLEERMGRVLAQAKANAPVVTGTYRDSLRVETVQHPTRVAVRVVSDVDYAMVVEAATGNLSRALDAAGGV